MLGGLFGCTGLLAGCFSLLEQDQSEGHKPQIEVFVVNALEESIQVTVTAIRGSTEFFTHSYTLTPDEGDESKSFVGTPTEIQISIQNGRDVTRDYSVPASCESPEVNVTIEADEIMVTNGCPAS
jgi:hypothetical protein